MTTDPFFKCRFDGCTILVQGECAYCRATRLKGKFKTKDPDYDKKYYQVHKQTAKNYYQAHKDQLLARQKEYRAAHKKQVHATDKKHYELHKGEILSKRKEDRVIQKEVNLKTEAFKTMANGWRIP
jgi:hypothetical protein